MEIQRGRPRLCIWNQLHLCLQPFPKGKKAAFLPNNSILLSFGNLEILCHLGKEEIR